MSDEEKVMPEANEEKPKQPERPRPLCGITAQLEESGQITHRIFGEKQNVSILYGLVEVMKKEVDAIASGMPGSTPSRDVRLLSNIATSITNLANVLIAMQSGLKQIMDAVEDLTNAKPEQKQPDSTGETVPSEGSGQ